MGAIRKFLKGKNTEAEPSLNVKNPLLIHHIQKTAGTAFIYYLESAFPEENRMVRLGNGEEENEQVARISEITDEEKESIKVIFGHHAFNMRKYFPDALQATFFRHPIERAISHYNFQNRVLPDGAKINTAHGLKEVKKRPSLEEVGEEIFLENLLEMIQEKGGYGGHGGYDGNFQLITLAYFLGHDPKNLKGSDVKKYLDELDFVGIQDHFNLSIFMLHKLYDFPLIPPPFKNHDAKSVGAKYFPKWFVDKCKECFSLDFMLYDMAMERFDEQYNKAMNEYKNSYSEWVDFQKECLNLND